jgi:hypothetical protein
MSPIDCGVLLCVLSRNAKNEAALAGIGLLRLRERERDKTEKKHEDPNYLSSDQRRVFVKLMRT